MKNTALPIFNKKYKIISTCRWPVGVWVVSVILLVTSLTPTQSAQVTPQSTLRLPKAEPIASLVAGQRQILTEPTNYAITGDGYLSYLGAPPLHHFAVSSALPGNPETTAWSFLKEQANLFGLKGAAVGLRHKKTKTSNMRNYVRFEQTYAGVPIFAAQMMVQVNAVGGVECVLSDIERDTQVLDNGSVSLTPKLSPEDASAKAQDLFRAQAFGRELRTTAPQLMIFAPSVGGLLGEIQLVWDMEISTEDASDLNKRLLLNAQTGNLAHQFALNYEALNRQIFNANNTPSDPGTLVRSEGQPASGINDVDNVYTFLGATYNFYSTQHGRDSIDGMGLSLSATVRYCRPNDPCPYQNAFWAPYPIRRMYYGAGIITDDITGHELTHGVTEVTSQLYYENASGAINESFSDVWGEFIDLSNIGVNDTPNVRWRIGEDIGAFRDMRDPTIFGDPDRLGSPLYRSPTNNPEGGPAGNDYGGVHANSGVNNKLCYLLTDGDTFNGQTVNAMGINRVAALYYEVQSASLLIPWADYGDLYNALKQAAINLNWTTSERANLDSACAAVEINGRSIYVDRGSPCMNQTGRFYDPVRCVFFGGPFKTVTQGINAVSSGGYLFIKANTYNEQITISKKMIIRSYDGVVTIGVP